MATIEATYYLMMTDMEAKVLANLLGKMTDSEYEDKGIMPGDIQLLHDLHGVLYSNMPKNN